MGNNCCTSPSATKRRHAHQKNSPCASPRSEESTYNVLERMLESSLPTNCSNDRSREEKVDVRTKRNAYRKLQLNIPSFTSKASEKESVSEISENDKNIVVLYVSSPS